MYILQRCLAYPAHLAHLARAPHTTLRRRVIRPHLSDIVAILGIKHRQTT